MDTTINEIMLYETQDSLEFDYPLNYEHVDTSLYQFSGIFKGDTIQFSAHKKTKEDFLLRKTKFRWVNEFSF